MPKCILLPREGNSRIFVPRTDFSLPFEILLARELLFLGISENFAVATALLGILLLSESFETSP